MELTVTLMHLFITDVVGTLPLRGETNNRNQGLFIMTGVFRNITLELVQLEGDFLL